ncbi:hypothetical protein EVAR_76152_1 [Eumeta japonica]|uniref:Uncharacterized protein n=1 Tax=Eumeta variegata TaxID=151549 RepID=A0A4C1UWF3_EUMVA|nr:hypothetical protein EVAR_76152_1 [Eumeta japonica]
MTSSYCRPRRWTDCRSRAKPGPFKRAPGEGEPPGERRHLEGGCPRPRPRRYVHVAGAHIIFRWPKTIRLSTSVSGSLHPPPINPLARQRLTRDNVCACCARACTQPSLRVSKYSRA